MRMYFPSWLALAVIAAGVVSSPVRLTAADDLNKEFIESFYRLRPDDADAFLKVQKSEAKPGAEASSSKESSDTNASAAADDNDPSWIGKFLQLSIFFLLGLIIYLLSRRSRSRGRY